MTVSEIKLSWFRGAGALATLPVNGKSLVLFGPNGSGKSSFVDAMEVAVRGGKVDHLSHEYSGKNQEKGLINTHAPDGTPAVAKITLKDGSFVEFRLNQGSAAQWAGRETCEIKRWEYSRTVLRQDEISEFIKAQKSEKYSAVLPLLGLGGLEIAAENLRQLSKQIAPLSNLEKLKSDLASAVARKKEVFKDTSDLELEAERERLIGKYCIGGEIKETDPPQTKTLSDAIKSIEASISGLSSAQKAFASFQSITNNGWSGTLRSARDAHLALSDKVEPLLLERLAVLTAASSYLKATDTNVEITECPACGNSVLLSEFHDHITSEASRLENLSKLAANVRTAVGLFCDDVAAVKSHLGSSELKSWREALTSEQVVHLDYIRDLDLTALRTDGAFATLAEVDQHLSALAILVAEQAKNTPPSVQDLVHDKAGAEALMA